MGGAWMNAVHSENEAVSCGLIFSVPRGDGLDVAGCGTPITGIAACCGLAGSGHRIWSSHDVATTAATVPVSQRLISMR